MGLYSLTHILRGSVRIEKNAMLCFAETVDWNAVALQGRGEHVLALNNPPRECPPCPEHCARHSVDKRGHCWTARHCQISKYTLQYYKYFLIVIFWNPWWKSSNSYYTRRKQNARNKILIESLWLHVESNPSAKFTYRPSGTWVRFLARRWLFSTRNQTYPIRF